MPSNMFAPSAPEGGPAMATRSRRRQRPKSSESLVQQPKAKRQRVPLTEQTFVNPDVSSEMVEVKADRVAKLSTRTSDDIENIHAHVAPKREASVRTKKQKHSDRATSKGDGSLLLTSTNAYVVSKLPALPDRIRADSSGNQRAEIFSSYGYALTLTPAHAIVWPYSSTSQSPETFTFNLPSASKPNDPLPVGSLVSPSASSTEPGLVVVLPGSGTVVYWESISSAATFDFIKSQRAGVEYVISGTTSGEKAVAITNAESAGFVLSFNTGRLAYMNVRDGHGRPGVSVQFLRTSSGAAAGGIFGSIRHAFSHLSLRGDIAAVRADKSARVGERNIVALTGKCRLQAWRIHRGGHHDVLGEADVREELIASLHENDHLSQDFPADSLEALDFTFVPKGLESKYLDMTRLSDAMRSDDPSVQHLLLLVSFTKRAESRYAMVELILTPQRCQIGMIQPITSYNARATSTDFSQTLRPRIFLPRPALVAFVIFERASVVASLAVPEESPDSQLQTESHALLKRFEDVVDFREDEAHEIVGSGIEELASVQNQDEGRSHRHKAKNPAAILMVRGAGVVRILTTDIDKFASGQPPKVSAKSKLEQAVFFGSKQDNPLMFDQRQGQRFSDEEMAEAALEVSHEILSSTSAYTSTLPASMEANLRERASFLERLMLHLRTLDVKLSREVRWKLLHNAEKTHVATRLWKLHEDFTAARQDDDKKSLIGLIVEFIHQDQKKNPDAEIGEVDRVRHWFVNDVFRLEFFVAWAYEVIKVLYKDRLLDEGKVTRMIWEAIQINKTTHFSAIQFRQNHLSLYGLENEELRLGVLTRGCEGLPEPWTGCHYIANNASRLTQLSVQWYKDHLKHAAGAVNKPDSTIVGKISHDLPDLIDGTLVSLLEYSRWALTVPDQKSMAQTFSNAYKEERYEKPLALTDFGKWDHAAVIAERHGSLDGLTVILLSHLQQLEVKAGDPSVRLLEAQESTRTMKAKVAKLGQCFAIYGKDFAFPTYEYLLEKHGVAAVLSFTMDKLGFKTQFVRSKPELARISWLNDIEAENDVKHAADTLIDLALTKEQQIWNKKIELSMGKLALLADAEDQNKTSALRVEADDARHQEQLLKVDNELGIITIQNALYALVAPTAATAIDDAAAVTMVVEAHGSHIPRRQKALLRIFEHGIGRLLRHEALDSLTLIDLLTLVAVSPEIREDVTNPFWLALKVANNSCHNEDLKKAKRLIWRRAYIRDDWAKVNDTQFKGDRRVVEDLAETELFSALADCIRFQNLRDPFRVTAPQEVLGVYSEALDRRFRDFDANAQADMLDAMRWEDKQLRTYIGKHRLAEWISTTFEIAQTQVTVDADDATQARLGDSAGGAVLGAKAA